MAQDLKNRRSQAGFSMVEMLIAAFILAVGILGLTMLQTMSLKAARGSRSLNTAVLLAQRVMDQADLEGRLTWLNYSAGNRATAAVGDFSNLRYVVIATGDQLVETFNGKGGEVVVGSSDPAESTPFFSVRTTRVPSTLAMVSGGISDFTVQVQFSENADANGAPIQRTVTLTRRIWHG